MSTKRQNREYLNFVVFEHLKNMPKIDKFDFYSDRTALLDFDVFTIGHNPDTACQIDSEYNCGRRGCLAGWYLMLSDRDCRLKDDERHMIRLFDPCNLASHFGITWREAIRLFGALNEGSTTIGTLRHRRGILNSIMDRKGDFDDA